MERNITPSSLKRDRATNNRLYIKSSQVLWYLPSVCGLESKYFAFGPNFNIPQNDKRVFLSTDIYNAAIRDNPTDTDVIKAFAPYLFYKMQKVGCFVLYDVDNNNAPFIYDINNDKKYLKFE